MSILEVYVGRRRSPWQFHFHQTHRHPYFSIRIQSGGVKPKSVSSYLVIFGPYTRTSVIVYFQRQNVGTTRK